MNESLEAPVPAQPVVVNPSVVPDTTGSMVRDVVVVLAFFPILLKAIGAHDANTVLHWLQSSDGATFLAVVVPVVVSAWRAWLAKQRKQALVQVAMHAPDTVAVVKQGPVA